MSDQPRLHGSDKPPRYPTDYDEPATPPAPTDDATLDAIVALRPRYAPGTTSAGYENGWYDGRGAAEAVVRAAVLPPAPTEDRECPCKDCQSRPPEHRGRVPAPTEDDLYDDIRQAAMGGPDFTPIDAPTEDATLDADIRLIRQYLTLFGGQGRDERTTLAALDRIAARVSAPITESALAERIENLPVQDAPYVEEDSYISGYSAGLDAAAAHIRGLRP